MDILNEKIKFVLTGHRHPTKTKIVHHKFGAVEFCVPSAFNRESFGIGIIDEGKFIYNEINAKNPSKCLMSSPLPEDQISPHQSFNEQENEIRVIYYINSKLKISGDLDGEMNCDQFIDNGAKLCKFPHTLAPGHYSIKIEGLNCNIKKNFYIGDIYKGKSEDFLYKKSSTHLIIIFCIIIVLMDLFIAFPFSCECKFIKEKENYIEGKDIHPNCKEKICFYLVFIFLGPLLIKYRFQNLNKYFTIFVFLLSLYPLFLPIFFMKSYFGKKALVFSFFVLVGNNFYPDPWSAEFTGIFYLLFLYPFLILVSGLKFKKCIIIFHICLLVVTYIGIIIIIIVQGTSTKKIFLFVNSIYVILPFIYLVVFFCFIKNINKKKDESLNDLNIDTNLSDAKMN